MITSTMGAVRAEVEKINERTWDNMVRTKDIEFHGLEGVTIGKDDFYLRESAQKNICYRFGIPYSYLRRCDYCLQAANLNAWLRKERNKNLFFRFDQNEVRAIFTPRYTPVDNMQILEQLRHEGFQDDTEVDYSMDDDLFMLNIPDKTRAYRVRGNNGDTMYPGISITNSEVGMSCLNINAFVLRLVCTNGLIGRTEIGSSYRHVSHRIIEEFPNTLHRIPYENNKQMERLEISTASKVNNPDETFSRFNRQFGLSKKECDAVEWGWSYEPGDTMFHIINAYTRGAQYPTLTVEEECNLQQTGGAILDMIKK